MRILVTAGPTREYIDPVRFISNPSTGKMGFAVARAALARGHDVLLVSGPVSLRPPRNADYRPVETVDEMARECLDAFDAVDAVVMAAAVGDLRPKRRHRHKQKKGSGTLSLELMPTVDIAAAMGRRKRNQRIVGFAVEDRSVARNARAKLITKNFDLIVANSPSAFGADRACVQVLGPEGVLADWPDVAKDALARRLVRFIETGSLPRGRSGPR